MNIRGPINLASATLNRLSKSVWIPALLTRLFVGYFFFESGWAKIHNLDEFTQNFIGWGIPYPAFNAALSAYTECIGGALTIAGLGTRFVSIAMIINMVVAIISVKFKEVSSLSDFVELDEPLYALTYVWLLFAGAGWLSLDAAVKVYFSRLFGNSTEAATPAPKTVAIVPQSSSRASAA